MTSPLPIAARRARSWTFGVLLVACAGIATGQEAMPRYLLPSSWISGSDGAVTVSALGSQVTFLPGLGWTTGWDLPVPEVREAGVVVTEPVAELLRLPRIVEVRSGLSDAGVRLVVDLADLPTGVWAPGGPLARREQRVGPDRIVSWRLPPVALPVDAVDGDLFVRDGVRIEVRSEEGATVVALRAPEAQLAAFPLREPDRLVLDLQPLAGGAPDDGTGSEADRATTLDVAPGVVYRRTRELRSGGASTVHVVELDPASVDLRVVGRSGEGRTVAGWSDGGLAAINAGYFDPATFSAIGLRRIGGTLLSWPSRNRAVVGFGPEGTVIRRAGARAQIDVDGVRVADLRLDANEGMSWSSVGGSRVGSARVGVLVLGPDGKVLSNTVGPRTVPDGGSALAYPAEVRPLALVEPGQRVDVGARLLPEALERATWAVEAGPLLLQNGAPAFAPEREGFARGQRILDEPTQQAALGVRPDGTVLFVVAERMVAADLVPLLAGLGASDALRLDSGSSATLVAGGRTVNRLLSRPVESVIVAVGRDGVAERR